MLRKFAAYTCSAFQEQEISNNYRTSTFGLGFPSQVESVLKNHNVLMVDNFLWFGLCVDETGIEGATILYLGIVLIRLCSSNECTSFIH